MIRKNQNGNALWFILLAVFLLGALTVLLNRGSSNTDETGSGEIVTIDVAELLRYTAGLSSVVEKLLLNGCSENDLSFYSTKWTSPAAYDNPNTPEAGTDFKCHVFNTAGGGYPFRRAPEDTTTDTQFVVSGANAIEGVGSAGSDLIILLGDLNEATCNKINKLLKVQNYAKDGIRADSNYFTGDFSVTDTTVGDDGTNPAYVAGKKAFCMESTAFGGMADGAYFFVQVLHAR